MYFDRRTLITAIITAAIVLGIMFFVSWWRPKPKYTQSEIELLQKIDGLAGSLHEEQTTVKKLKGEIELLFTAQSATLAELFKRGVKPQTVIHIEAAAQTPVAVQPPTTTIDTSPPAVSDEARDVTLTDARKRFSLTQGFLVRPNRLEATGDTFTSQNQLYELNIVRIATPEGHRRLVVEGYELDPTTKERVQPLVVDKDRSKDFEVPDRPPLARYAVDVYGEFAHIDWAYGASMLYRPFPAKRVLDLFQASLFAKHYGDRGFDYGVQFGLHKEW